MDSLSSVHWKPKIYYPSHYESIELVEPSRYETSDLSEWKIAFKLLSQQIISYFNLSNIVINIFSDIIWIVSDFDIPDTGDVKRDYQNNNDTETKCNKLEIIKHICKLYKPSIWNNMGFGFVSPQQYELIKKSNLKVDMSLQRIKSENMKRINLNKMSKDSISTTSSNSNEILHEESSSSSSEEKDQYSHQMNKKLKYREQETYKIIDEEAFKKLKKPPSVIWRRGKRSNQDKLKIIEWEKELKSLGYDPLDYKRYVHMKRLEEANSKNNKLGQLADAITNSELTSDDDESSSKKGTEDFDDLDGVSSLLYSISQK